MMADLSNLPTIALQAEAQSPLTDYGPAVLDAATMARFVDLVDTGIVVFDTTAEDLTAVMSDAGDTLDAMFGLYLGEQSTNRFAIDHRAFALSRAVRELVKRRQVVEALPSALPSIPRAIGNLEVYLSAFKAEHFEGTLLAALADAGLLLTPEVVAKLLSATPTQLAGWRSQGNGPRFVKLAQQKSSIRYPAAAVLEWLGTL